MTDIMIYETGNGGGISLKNGDIETIDGLSNQPYLAHFGGNVEASTTGEEVSGVERSDWWGNTFFQNDLASQMNSELERALNNNALTSAGRIVIAQAAKNDLDYLSDIANVNSDALISGVDKLLMSDTLNQSQASFIWDATKNELIEEIII
jgi:hypothetical protein